MKLWPLFVIGTILCWGAYVPMIHHGQKGFAPNGPLRAFLFVGLAYFVVAVVVPWALLAAHVEPTEFKPAGMKLAFAAGVLGAIGALGIIFAMKYGGKPVFVAPLVFAGAPVLNTFISMAWDKPAQSPSGWFYTGIVITAAGAAMVLYHKPA